jgi:hypothetical protein
MPAVSDPATLKKKEENIWKPGRINLPLKIPGFLVSRFIRFIESSCVAGEQMAC